MNNKNTTISISTATIIKIILILIVLVFLYLIREVLALIFVALVLASAFDPWVDWFHQRRIPRGLGILVIYIILFSIISASVFLLITPISNEVKDIALNFPHYYQKVLEWYGKFQSLGGPANGLQLDNNLTSLGDNIGAALNKLINTVFSIFGGIVSFFLILVITFYFSVEEEGVKRFVRVITPLKHQPYVMQLIVRMQRKMGLWLRGQIILSLIIFVLVFTGLSILGIKYALLLAFLAGIFEIIPFLGPTISAVPAIFLALTQSPLKALFVVILYLIVQQLENHIITPKVMGKTVDLNPLIVIIVILIGVKVGGVIGALMAVPVATALSVFLKDVFESKERNELKLES